MDESERRQALADFLRTRRARLQPAQVGFPVRAGRRRRTPGLRREEVAELANIGVSWYTLLEQGQDVHPSRQVLENLAQALRLSQAEELHLFALAGHELAKPKPPSEAEQLSPALARLIEALNPHPAFVIGRRWDVLTWNRAAGLIFHFDQPCPPHSLNVVWRYFQGSARAQDADWEVKAQTLVAQFRADYARYPDDESFREIITDLQQASEHFRQWWAQQDVRGLPDGPRAIQHPTLGELNFEHVSFQTTDPDLRIKVYSASPDTAARLAEALKVIPR